MGKHVYNVGQHGGHVLNVRSVSPAPDAVVEVIRGDTDADSGQSLLDAYAAAKTLTPGGNALSATNRATVLIPPGRYELPAELELDSDYVDLSGSTGAPEATIVTSSLAGGSGSTLKQSVRDIRLSNFTIHFPTVQDGSHALDIDCGTHASGSASMDALGSKVLQATSGTPFANIEDGDVIYLEKGADKFALRLTGKVSDTIAYVDQDPVVQAGYDYVIHEVNHESIYRNMRFTQSSRTGSLNYGAVFGTRSVAGSWFDCYADEGWRLAANAALTGEFYRCGTGVNGWVGDSDVTALRCYMEDCWAGKQSFGGCASYGCDIGQGATLIRCRADLNSFALGKAIYGTLIDCECSAGPAFGGTVSGSSYHGSIESGARLIRCRVIGSGGSSHSFGAGQAAGNGVKGVLVDCELLSMTQEMRLTGAVIQGCRLKSSGAYIFSLEDGNSRIYGGTYVATVNYIYAASAQNVVAAHTRSNVGLHANVTNLVATPYNVVDSNVDL